MGAMMRLGSRKELRPIRVEGDIAYIPLTQGYEAIIDAVDVPLVNKWNWKVQIGKWAKYAVRCDGRTGPHNKAIRLHRHIMEAPDGIKVDHRNGDGLLNRRENLRLATSAQNSQNQRLRKTNTSGVKGVSWHGRSGKWRVQICVNRKVKYVGVFVEIGAAKAAYENASVAMHGEFSRFE